MRNFWQSFDEWDKYMLPTPDNFGPRPYYPEWLNEFTNDHDNQVHTAGSFWEPNWVPRKILSRDKDIRTMHYSNNTLRSTLLPFLIHHCCLLSFAWTLALAHRNWPSFLGASYTLGQIPNIWNSNACLFWTHYCLLWPAQGDQPSDLHSQLFEPFATLPFLNHWDAVFLWTLLKEIIVLKCYLESCFPTDMCVHIRVRMYVQMHLWEYGHAHV